MDETIRPDTSRLRLLSDSTLLVGSEEKPVNPKTKDLIYPVISILGVVILLILLFNNRSH